MIRKTVATVVVSLLLTGSVSGLEPVVQPSTIPGEWKLYEAPLPPIEDVVKGPRPGKMVYGLYTWAGEYRHSHDGIKDVGWPSFRIAGPMDDETMKMVVEDGVEVMQTLGLRVHGASKRRPDYDSDEAFIGDYLKGVDAYLTRYGPGGTFFKENPGLPERPIMHVEIWNEPNFQYMIPPDDRPRPEVEADREALYARVLPAAYAAVKEKWPTVKVVGFGAGGSGHGDVRFILHVHEKNPAVKDSYDILSTHPYLAVPPESWAIRSWGRLRHGEQPPGDTRHHDAVRHGRSPHLYTEVGWTITKEEGGLYEVRGGTTALLQAAYICRQYVMSLRLGTQRCHIMFASDTDNTNKGVFARDGSWRPAAHAIRNMIWVMPDPRLVDAIGDGEDGYYAYLFDPNHPMQTAGTGGTVMAWNVEGPKTVQIPFGAQRVEVIDMLGSTRELRVTDGTVTVEIGPCPVYIRSVNWAGGPQIILK